MPKMLSFRANDELATQIETAAETAKVTQSDIVRTATEWYFGQEQRQKNVQLLLDKVDHLAHDMRQLTYEMIRMRAILIRIVDPQGTAITETLLDLAAQDAKAYLEEQKKEDR